MALLAAGSIVVAANIAPALFGITPLARRFPWPLDAGLVLPDGHRLLGSHKTLAGLVLGVLAAATMGLAWGLAPATGAAAGLLAMAGDLASSFLKRRLGLAAGSRVPVLDQGLEALLPLLFLHHRSLVDWPGLLVVLVLFCLLAYPAAIFKARVLDTPPVPDYPRLVRSATRFKEWRACHAPIAVWQRYLNFEYVIVYEWLFTGLVRLLGLYGKGRANTARLGLTRIDLFFPHLPPAFDGYRILLLADLHADGDPELPGRLAALVSPLAVDLCLVAGDIRAKLYGPTVRAIAGLKRITRVIKAADGIFGVLGNHDCIEMIPELEDAGIVMLVNDSEPVTRGKDRLWLVGVDDPHYYKCHDLTRAFREVPAGAFIIFLAHSPELSREAAARDASLYLCGHTHGGQVRLPGLGPLFTHSRSTPRRMVSGPWQAGAMQGYTSRGVGSSTVMVRFNCEPEATVITLRQGTAPRKA
ncbi:MAG: CDP-archaeol synthase [Thermodesulfobacteriota bacterium]